MILRTIKILVSFILILIIGKTALAVDYRLVLVDRTGSMAELMYSGMTRWQRAKDLAKQDVQGFPTGTNMAVMYFDSQGIILLQNFTTDKQTVLNSIDNIPGPGALTPLADALCKAANELKIIAQTEDIKRLYTYTDGYENYSNASNQDVCDTCDFLVGTGWYNDCDPCDSNPPCTNWQICLAKVLINTGVNWVRYFGEPITAATEASYYVESDEVNKNFEGEVERAGPNSAEYAFLQCVAQESGGQFIFVPDTPECSDGIDNDGNGCADYPTDTGCSSSQDNSESGGSCQPNGAAPTLTPYGLGILISLVLATGV